MEKLTKQTIQYYAKNKKQQHSDEEASAETTTVESTSGAVKNDMFGSPSGDSTTSRSFTTQNKGNVTSNNNIEGNLSHPVPTPTDSVATVWIPNNKSRVTISEMYPVLDDKWQPLTLSMGGKYKDCHAPAMMLISTSISVENDS